MDSTIKEDKVLGCIYGVLAGDALGGPVQFKERGTFERITGLREIQKFTKPAGTWSDDGSLTLCLAQALIDNDGEYDDLSFVRNACDWFANGYLSSLDRAWDIGSATKTSLRTWQKLLDENQLRSPQLAQEGLRNCS